MKNRLFLFLFLFLFFIIISSCKKIEKRSIFQKIFKLKIGFEEGNIGYFSEKDILSDEKKPNIFQIGGFYYVSDPKNNKIMKLTKSGVPVLIIYNSEFNPQIIPTITNKTNEASGDEEIAYIKLYRDYEISSPSIITSDNNKNIFIINKHPDYKKFNDDGSVSDSLILKFNDKGDFIHKIGINGINSNPFSNIIDIKSDSKNNIVINEYKNNSHLIYKFDTDGKLINKNKISIDNIPLSNKEKKYLIDIIDVKLGYKEDEVYITCQYIKKSVESFTITTYKLLYEKVFKYSLSAKTMNLMLKIDPDYIDISKVKDNPNVNKMFGNKKKILQPQQNLIGIDKKGFMFFSQKKLTFDGLNQNVQILKIYDLNGKLKQSFLIEFPIDIDFCSELLLSPEGRVFSYYIQNGELQFVTNN